LRSKFKQERKAAQELRQQNIPVFLPLYKLEKTITDNKVTTKEPLFSRYLFAFLDSENTNWGSVRSTKGISNIVTFGNGPIVVNQSIINELKTIDLLPVEPCIKIGEELRITSGTFKGLKAIYQSADGESRSYILLKFMQQNQHLSMHNQLIKKI
jgi:transcriptional antiterminator RfaH